MSGQQPSSYTRIAIAIVVAGLIVAATISASSVYEKPVTKTVTVTSFSTLTSSTLTSTSQQASCTNAGEALPVFIRVVADTNQTPVEGAYVTASYVASSYSSHISPDGGCDYTLLSNSTITTSFATNKTEWYSLPIQNIDISYNYSMLVEYSGDSYKLGVQIRTESVTCLTLGIPSGMWNVTIAEFQTTCPSITLATTTG